MSVLSKMSLRWKLIGSFALVLVLLGAVAVIGWRNTGHFSEEAHSLYADRLVPAVELADVQKSLYELRLGALSYATADPATRAAIREQQGKWLKRADDATKAFAATKL